MKEYPKTARLLDGSEAVLRLMTGEDAAALYAFFCNLPDESRLVLKDDVTDRAVIERWAAEVDYSRVIPILAFAGEAVVGDATIHLRPHGWSRHVGEFRVVVAPQYRKKGLASILAKEVVRCALDLGVEKLMCELMEEQEALRKLLERAGFRTAAKLRRFIKDVKGRNHDLVMMTHDVRDVWRTMGDMVFYKDFSTI